MKSLRWTSKDLDAFPEDEKRYEIIDGELYVSRQPHWNHQNVCSEVVTLLKVWNKQYNIGGIATAAPGLIFSEDDDAAPDVIWISKERLATALQDDGKLHDAPELVVEVLSPGSTNESRDREVKRKLYSRRGVVEYWIISWPKRQVEVYRRDATGVALVLIQTLFESDILQSPLLPDFSCQVSEIFVDII